MDDVMIREATKVKEEFQQKARSLFDRIPIGWDLKTITYLYHLALSLPGKIPVFTRFVIAQSQVLGVIGPTKQAYIHQVIPSRLRASVVSLESMSGNAGGVLGQTSLGYLARVQASASG